MLKIYLDHNIYQELKKPEFKTLLEKVLVAKEYVVFCFSEAHLYDLNHDRTDAKFEDMSFIEAIADDHCYVFTDHTKFIACTPEAYYDDFEWPSSFGFEDADSPFWKLLMSLLKTMPLELHNLIKGIDLPTDMPESLKKLLQEPATMYDWYVGILDLSTNLSVEQNKFRELLQYLHKNCLLPNLYELFGITGFDGEKVTDISAFRDSYAQKFIVNGEKKSRYSLFMDMYCGLELHGLVKGKPKKQKMMNLINDSRHAFFGTVCDVIVSKDSDFLAKTRFMYKIEQIGTTLLSFSDFEPFLDNLKLDSQKTVLSLFDEIATPIADKKIIGVIEKENGESSTYTELQHLYYGYFNLLVYTEDKYDIYWTIARKMINYNNIPFKYQIKYIVSRLLNELGPDIHQKGFFSFEESLEDKTEIRCWSIQNIIFSLVLDEVLYMNVYPLRYLEKRWKKNDFENNKVQS